MKPTSDLSSLHQVISPVAQTSHDCLAVHANLMIPCPNSHPEHRRSSRFASTWSTLPVQRSCKQCKARRYPAHRSDLPRFVTNIKLVVRSLGCLPAKGCSVPITAPVGSSPWTSRSVKHCSGDFTLPFGPTNTETRTYPVLSEQHAAQARTSPTPFSQFGSFVLAAAWTSSLACSAVPKATHQAVSNRRHQLLPDCPFRLDRLSYF